MAHAERISLDELLLRLNQVTAHGENWQAQCPAHEDSRASLSISQGRNGGLLLKCFAGCTFHKITAALGYQPSQLCGPRSDPKSLPRQSAVYDYRDATGTMRFQVVRFEPKDFRQRRPDGAGGWTWNMHGVQKTPYRLNELKGHSTIFIVEGEKDCDSLWRIGCPATCNVGGAGKWHDEYSSALDQIGVQRVVLLADNDAPGRKHMTDVARSVKVLGLSVMLLELPGLTAKGADVSDWLNAGHTRSELDALVDAQLWVVGKHRQPEAIAPIDPDDDPTRWHLTELGAAEAFIHREGNNVRYDTRQDRWLAWSHHIWRPDADNAVYRLTHQHVRQWQTDSLAHVPDKALREKMIEFLFKLEQRAKIENIIAISKTLKPVADTGEDWDQNPWLLGVGNGVLDLQSGLLRAGERADRITMQTATEFHPDADCPRWRQFLAEVFDADQELIDYVQRALGYSLTGDMREQCFFMCVGSGSNGKSTFTNTLGAVWGCYAYTTDMRTFTTNHQGPDNGFDIAELAHRRLVLASETKSDSRLNEQALKNFTGGEKMNAQRKYGHPFEYSPTGKIWMGLNHQPRVKDDSYGFWRRVRIIPFQHVFGGSLINPNLRAELTTEASGVLRWAVEGCLQWQKTGLRQPLSVLNATDAYKEAEDPLNDFVLERCVADSDAETYAAGIYKGYVEWASDQGLSSREYMAANVFGRLFSRRFSKKHTDAGTRYLGVRLKVRPRDLLSSNV